MSSSTDPFVPQEKKYGVSRAVLEAMIDAPPDMLILQTHSHRVAAYADVLLRLAERCELRVHLSIETNRESIPGLPRHASSVADRFDAARQLHDVGLHVVITVSPLLPIEDPVGFFEKVATCASAVVLDHYIGGDGSIGGARTLKTGLPAAVEEMEPEAVLLGYRDRMAEIAERYLPGKVGISADGFAGRRLGN